MTVKIAINGFGRIGRLVYRAMLEQGIVGKGKAVDVVAVGDIVPADNLAYLLQVRHDAGPVQGEVRHEKVVARQGRRRRARRQRRRDEGRQREVAGRTAVEGDGRRCRHRMRRACSPKPRRPRGT